MCKATALAIPIGLALWLSSLAFVAAHEGEAELAVEPSTVTAGETVILAGGGLEPNSDRVLVLAGEDLIVEFGTVRTDAEGTFQKELTIPGHLPAGTYEFRAIGDETLTVPLGVLEAVPVVTSPATNVTPAPGTTPAAHATPVPAATVEPVDPTKTVVPRERSPLDLALLLGFVALAVALGGLLVWRAERFRRAPGA
jgi:hypothetical protein